MLFAEDGSDIPAWVEQQGGTLHFTTVTRTDAGNYTCLAANNQQGEIRAVVQLTVAGTHKPFIPHSTTHCTSSRRSLSILSCFLVYVVFKLKPENTTVYQGHTAVLHCQASGDPPPFIQWKKKDTFLEADKSRSALNNMCSCQ